MVQSFTYRNPRFVTSLPVEFLTPEGLLAGRIQDISERGLAIDFGQPVCIGTRGRVRFSTGHSLLELEAEAAHTEGFTAGLVFTFASERECAFVRAVLQALSLTCGADGPAHHRT